jgi:uncharacterized protein
MASLVDILARAGTAFIGLFPYLLLGVLTGQLLRGTALTSMVRGGCERSLPVAVLLAAVLGAVSPLCTYGTVPLMLQLLAGGVPVAPLCTFLSASSLMNPQLFILTAGGLGLELAMVRVAAVLVFGALLGLAVHHLPRRFVVNPGALSRAAAPEAAPAPAPRLTVRGVARGTLHGLEFVGFYFIIGVLVGAVVEVLVPGRWVARLFAGGRWSSVFVATVLGVPLYACGGGAIPLVRSAIRQGMSRGAALAFLIIGPATRVTPLMSLTAMLRPRAVLLYVALLFAFSMVAGLLYR